MSTDLDASFNEQFINISTKLKKRFLRKPNIAEATNEFNALAIQCEHSEQPSFAGHSYIGAAKCEASAGNFLGEAEYYLAAARQFMKAELKLFSLKCHSPARENLESALGCYIQALNKYPEGSSLGTAVLMEMARGLEQLSHRLEALAYYEQALETMGDTSLLRLQCMQRMLSLNVLCGRYDIALEVANTICDSKLSTPGNMLTETQISRILLALLVETDVAKKSPSLERLFEDLLNDSDDVSFNTDLTLKLQSIVISCSSKDLESLVEVSANADRFFTLQQKELLQNLIRRLDRHS